MDTIECKEVIISTLKRRGEGIEGDPIRVVTEVYEKDGTKIAEYDSNMVALFKPNVTAWILINKTQPIPIDERFPVYYSKQAAEKGQDKYGGITKKVELRW